MVLNIKDYRRDIKRGLDNISHLLRLYTAESATHNRQLTTLLQATQAQCDALEKTMQGLMWLSG
jgi:hypothetical protein